MADGLRLRPGVSLQVYVEPPGGVSPQKVEDTRVALRELGLSDHLELDPDVSPPRK